ncbi:hypothetical protein ABZ816_31585 [Actinosynnema sp. NPDC047251]|uniref:Uncharacterized protein n=1 Tax=Saccharothrix espanaensis (strain ATCC 51144 / DSM 44229 / JCM 9112 / NBRC 15066 / NRRL 15764) TaxID=1179773 RepID=K0K0M3_SACES|nr:hypothetical protein [Saccharothrix espanaensis]CCH30078.1 hypothetical protein BN6_27660 [Saccharothrix espanaensis DSM 44229]
MAVHVVSRRRGAVSVEKAHPGAMVVDVTSRGPEPWVRLSPFYPHGGIPVPFTPHLTGASVEGIWQALKVFREADVDLAKLRVTGMTGLKRTVRRFGEVLGHRAGADLLSYEDARRRIYLPVYRWVLENRAVDEVAALREPANGGDVVLLDHTTNGDVTDLSTPLSHAALLRHYLCDTWPADTPGPEVTGAGPLPG